VSGKKVQEILESNQGICETPWSIERGRCNSFPRETFLRIMIYRIFADITVLLHLGFVLFVVLGGLLVLRWRWLAWFHIPAALWGTMIEFAGWICPLTPLENWLRKLGGEAGYAGGFVEHYIIGILYPEALSRELQYALGAFVLGVNGFVYWRFFKEQRGSRSHLRHDEERLSSRADK
jgi:hypothetical protein